MRPPAAATRAALLLALLAPAAARAQERPSGEYYVYVAAESEDQVSLVRFGPDGAEVVEDIVVGLYPTEMDGPHGIAVDPLSERWYVSIAHGKPFGQVHAYSTVDNREIGYVAAGLFPASMAITPTNLLFVANFNLHGDPVPSSVSVIETESLSELAQIPACETPHGSRLSPDGQWDYVVCVRDEQLVEIGTADLAVSRRLYLAPNREQSLPPEVIDADGYLGEDAAPRSAPRCGPTWVQPSVDGRFVYVACNRNAEVLEVDTEAWEVTRRFPTGAGPYNLDVTPDGQKVVVSYKGAQATGVIDLDSGQARSVANSRRLPHGVAISPDSRYAFVSVEGIGGEPGTVDVIDLDGMALAASVDIGKQAGGIGFWKYVPGLLHGERRAGERSAGG